MLLLQHNPDKMCFYLLHRVDHNAEHWFTPGLRQCKFGLFSFSWSKICYGVHEALPLTIFFDQRRLFLSIPPCFEAFPISLIHGYVSFTSELTEHEALVL